MSERAPYSRVYWSINEDEKFDGIRNEPKLVGAWLLMLIAADQAYPSPAYLLPQVPRSTVGRLSEAGLVSLLDGHRYRITGLPAERERRRAAATSRGPNGTRTVPKREANGDLDKTRQDEDETSLGQDEPRDPADIYWQMVGRYPTEKARDWIDSMTEKYGAEPVIAACAKAFLEDRSTATLLSRTQDFLAAGARKLEVAERIAQKAALAEHRAKPRVEEPELTDDQIRELADRYREDHAA